MLPKKELVWWVTYNGQLTDPRTPRFELLAKKFFLYLLHWVNRESNLCVQKYKSNHYTKNAIMKIVNVSNIWIFINIAWNIKYSIDTSLLTYRHFIASLEEILVKSKVEVGTLKLIITAHAIHGRSYCNEQKLYWILLSRLEKYVKVGEVRIHNSVVVRLLYLFFLFILWFYITDVTLSTSGIIYFTKYSSYRRNGFYKHPKKQWIRQSNMSQILLLYGLLKFSDGEGDCFQNKTTDEPDSIRSQLGSDSH